MADYTYLFADLLTGEILGELPLFGTYFEKYASQAGNGNFSFKIGQGAPEDTLLDDMIALEMTAPGKNALYVDRDGSLIWGGIVWSRTYQSQAKTMQCTAQTMDSYFTKRYCHAINAWSNYEQRNIVRELYQMMVQEYGRSNDLGFILPGAFDPNSSVRRQLNINFNDFQTYWDLMSGVFSQDDGFDFLADVQYVNGVPQRYIAMGYPNLGLMQDQASNLTFEYPGAIENYYWPESVSDACNQAIAIGSGDGDAKLWAYATNQSSLNSNYPLLESLQTYADVSVLSTLNAHARADLAARPVPTSVPSLSVNPAEFDFNDLTVGTYARIVIQDCRFPNGFDQTVKINGWTLTPDQSSSVETCNLVLAGSDGGDGS